MDDKALIDDFLAGRVYAVVGASTNREKYGNKVLRCYMQNDLVAWPVHPTEEEIEEITCARDLMSLPEDVHGVSIITPPKITEQVVEDAAKAGIKRLWMQPGAENEASVARAKELGMHVIAGGPCLLVALGYKE